MIGYEGGSSSTPHSHGDVLITVRIGGYEECVLKGQDQDGR